MGTFLIYLFCGLICLMGLVLFFPIFILVAGFYGIAALLAMML
jgi:hypothetical protein